MSTDITSELRSRANALDGIADGVQASNKIRADQIRYIASAIELVATRLEASPPLVHGVPEGTWQDISTAPKGDWILGWAPGWTVVTMSWINVPQHNIGPGWFVSPGKLIPATHWMPLPSPPLSSIPKTGDST